jgi:hypothetical protein
LTPAYWLVVLIVLGVIVLLAAAGAAAELDAVVDVDAAAEDELALLPPPLALALALLLELLLELLLPPHAAKPRLKAHNAATPKVFIGITSFSSRSVWTRRAARSRLRHTRTGGSQPLPIKAVYHMSIYMNCTLKERR